MFLKSKNVFIKISIVLVIVGLFFSSDGQKDSPPSYKVIVKDITGIEDALYKKDEKDAKWEKLSKNMELQNNTIISTGKDTEVVLDLGSGKGEFTIKQLSMIKVVDFEIKPVGNTQSLESKVQVKIGKVNLKLKKTEQLQGQIKVETPTETASITGTDCDFRVTPYGSRITVNETAKRIEVNVPTAGLTLNIVTREGVETTTNQPGAVSDVKTPIQIVKEVADRKDIQHNITLEEKKFQITVNVNLDNIKPVYQRMQEEVPKEVIKNTVIQHREELPPPIVSYIEQIISSTIETSSPTTTGGETSLPPTGGGGSGGTTTPGGTSCSNNLCF